MNKPTGFHIAAYLVLVIFACATFVIAHFYSVSYEYFTIQRSLASSIGYILFVVIGILNLIKPQISVEAFKCFNRRKNTIDRARFSGVALLLISILSIYNSWAWILK